MQLAHQLAPVLETEQLEPVFRELEMPLVPVLADIERAGILVDAGALATLSRRLEQDLHGLTTRVHELGGRDVQHQLAAPTRRDPFRQTKVADAAKDREDPFGIDRGRRARRARRGARAARLILDWRGLQKLKGTYVDALPQLVNPDTGRVHTSFNQAIAATGRLSSSDPNLQNIPIRSEVGREIRRAFVAAPGHVLISADYSQIELRVLAHLAEDEALAEAFRQGEDIHDRTALSVFGSASGLDPHELRRRAKIINYALLYGKTSFTLARDIGVTKEAAQEFIDAYFAGFPRVRQFIDETLMAARESGVVKTMFGRRRLVPELNSRNGQVRAATERATVNMPIQGTAADILKKAMIDLHAALPARKLKARMILTVHDELLFESPRAEADDTVALARERMENAVRISVPLTVDVGVGDNWRDAKP